MLADFARTLVELSTALPGLLLGCLVVVSWVEAEVTFSQLDTLEVPFSPPVCPPQVEDLQLEHL